MLVSRPAGGAHMMGTLPKPELSTALYCDVSQRELGRLVNLCATLSEGGYVVISATEKGRWRVHTRIDGVSIRSHGAKLGDALYHAACRLMAQPF